MKRTLLIAALLCLAATLAVVQNARIVVISLTMDGLTSVEAGGAALGCTMPVTMTVEQVIPASLSGIPTTTLSHGSQVTN